MHHLHGSEMLRDAAAVRSRELLPGVRRQAFGVPRVPFADHAPAKIFHVKKKCTIIDSRAREIAFAR